MHITKDNISQESSRDRKRKN